MTKKKQRYPQDVPPATAGRQVKLKQKIIPKNTAQEFYLESLRNTLVTIANGPAGSAKTWLATGIALEKLISNQVSKIILTRPVVEAEGESLGFLPGTLEQKLDPYLKPLFDAIEDFVGPTMAKKLLEDGKIEIAPLAYMRGRTFNYCYVILDEAQNCTVKQMKLLLTRAGEETTFAINGDLSQCDIKPPKGEDARIWKNGLQFAIEKLSARDEDIQFIEFFDNDVVRSNLCKKLVKLLDSPDRREPSTNEIGRSTNSRTPGALMLS